ncbi:indole-3-glycerol phosphate synthase TrpC [Megasphaera sueciensis]|jgi:indole-3-glycerol phosphate synthase|uniref:indole-3-glycerol phosphate synthase TrpC n=1 Tax=Megasphaera sueciensis TaxID=349094 RepID=UPI003CFBDB44
MILDDIIQAVRQRVEADKTHNLLQEMKEQALAITSYGEFPFENVLSAAEMSFICEVKKASPSKGLIAPDFPYLAIAEEYEKAGAAAISVLTERDYFKGSPQYLQHIAETVSVPIIRKDFIIDAYQIYEAKVLGASAILLICAVLDDETLCSFFSLADRLGLSVLVEAHDEAEIDRALRCGARIIGVNNRNLKDFTVSLDTSCRLRRLVPQNVLFVAESGIKTAEDIRRLKTYGVNAVLIGETLMRSRNKKEMLQELQGGSYD